MSLPLLVLVINHIAFDGQQWLIEYTLTSRYSRALFLVQDQNQPFVRIGAEGALLEIWLGIPPRSDREKNKLINALILPQFFELPPGATLNKRTILTSPLKESGYWLEPSEQASITFEGKTEIHAQLVQGFGISRLEHQNIRSINGLYSWQLTARSQIVVLTLPPVNPSIPTR